MHSMVAVTPAADMQALEAGSTVVADPSGDITVADLGVATTAVESEDTTVVFAAAQDPEPTRDAGRWEACAELPSVMGARKQGALGHGKVTAPATRLPAGISFPQEIAAIWAALQAEPHLGVPAKPRWQEPACPRAASPMATGTPLASARVRQVQAPFRTYI